MRRARRSRRGAHRAADPDPDGGASRAGERRASCSASRSSRSAATSRSPSGTASTAPSWSPSWRRSSTGRCTAACATCGASPRSTSRPTSRWSSALVLFSGGGESVFTFLYVAVIAYAALLLERGGALARRWRRLGRLRRGAARATARGIGVGPVRRALAACCWRAGSCTAARCCWCRRWRRGWSPSSSAPAPRSRSAPATWRSSRRSTSARSRA